MDAFILAAAVPVMSYTLAKKELFLIPFFAWSLAVYGGVAVDRNNRSQAVQALHAAVVSVLALILKHFNNLIPLFRSSS